MWDSPPIFGLFFQLWSFGSHNWPRYNFPCISGWGCPPRPPCSLGNVLIQQRVGKTRTNSAAVAKTHSTVCCRWSSFWYRRLTIHGSRATDFEPILAADVTFKAAKRKFGGALSGKSGKLRERRSRSRKLLRCRDAER